MNRTEEYDVQANGKGVNVSLILQQLGVTSTALVAVHFGRRF
ncbi:hypothetical protein RU85_GL000587 [Lactococcus garvieae]|nr:hypothetical protein RU85_GL000587 [Lactococcus garvieae]